MYYPQQAVYTEPVMGATTSAVPPPVMPIAGQPVSNVAPVVGAPIGQQRVLTPVSGPGTPLPGGTATGGVPGVPGGGVVGGGVVGGGVVGGGYPATAGFAAPVAGMAGYPATGGYPVAGGYQATGGYGAGYGAGYGGGYGVGYGGAGVPAAGYGMTRGAQMLQVPGQQQQPNVVVVSSRSGRRHRSHSHGRHHRSHSHGRHHHHHHSHSPRRVTEAIGDAVRDVVGGDHHHGHGYGHGGYGYGYDGYGNVAGPGHHHGLRRARSYDSYY